jgi:hypothetical protein
MLDRLVEQGEDVVAQLVKDQDYEDLMDIAWEKLHAGRWDRIDRVWREVYACAALGKAKQATKSRDAFRIADLGLMMGAGEYREALKEFVEEMERKIEEDEDGRIFKKPRNFVLDDKIDQVLIDEDRSVKRISCSELSLIGFIDVLRQKQPLIIEGLFEDWPAAGSGDQSWRNIDNLIRMAGHRYVPVEVGQHYASENWAQKMMFFVSAFTIVFTFLSKF